MKTKCIVLLSLLGAVVQLFSQTTNTDNKTGANTTGRTTTGRSQTPVQPPREGIIHTLIPNPQLALSTPDYRVTAGDVYILAYLAGNNAVEYTITVDSTYRIRVSNLGIIDAAGKTFNQLRTQVETIVSNNYPLGGVQFALKQPATFKVYIKGEVVSSREVEAWALTRVSTILDEHLTPYASTRNVTIRSSNGQTRVYDLYKADRLGDVSQNPYVRPDDVITINRVERQVTIDGEVERPGTYQLLAGENIKQLIEIYGNGLTPLADISRIDVIRFIAGSSKSGSGDSIPLSAQDLDANFVLQHYDIVTIPDITTMRPVLFIEGAVGNKEIGTTASLEASTQLTVPFIRGEYYGALIRRNRDWFSAVSDTKNAYIIREERHIPINLNPMLYDENFHGDQLIQENDTLIIPFRQYFVTVAGAVAVPGRYPYIPDRTWDYYVALAGGFVAGRNSLDAVDIINMSGKKLAKTNMITPETIITAKTNNPLFYFNQYAPVVTTALSIVSTFLSIYMLINR